MMARPEKMAWIGMGSLGFEALLCGNGYLGLLGSLGLDGLLGSGNGSRLYGFMPCCVGYGILGSWALCI